MFQHKKGWRALSQTKLNGLVKATELHKNFTNVKHEFGFQSLFSPFPQFH